MNIIQRFITNRASARSTRAFDRAVRDGTFKRIKDESFRILSAKMNKSYPDWREHKAIVKRVKAAAHNCAVNELKEKINGGVR